MENNNIKEFKYGDDSNQFIRLYLPNNILSSSSSSSSPIIIFIIIHGGFWKNKYTIDNSAIETLSPFLIEHDHPVCLIEYRRCSQDSDGGWPNTNKDIINGLNTTYKKCNELNMNIKKYILLGHSAGGTLALWSCCCLDERELLFRPSLCVAIAPIGDLEEGQKKRLSDDGDAIQIYMGGKLPIDNNNNNNNNNEDPYKLASPSCNLPIMVPTIIVGGENDKDVPVDIVEEFHIKSMMAYSNSSKNDITAPDLLIIKDADHYQLTNANSSAWIEIYNLIKNNHLIE